MTRSEKENYCNEVNFKCEFNGSLCLTPENVTENQSKRAFIKNGMNSIVGKFGAKPVYNSVKYVYSFKQLVKEVRKANSKVTDIELVNHKTAKLLLEHSSRRPNKNTNTVISSYVTAYSR